VKLKAEDYGEVLWCDKKRIFGLPISLTRYVLSPSKLFVNKGMLSIREDRLEIYRITDMALSLPLTERIFGCGTIEIHAKDKTNPVLLIRCVKEPRKVLQALEECLTRERQRYNIVGCDMFGALC
jgi:uncharacterized membrane protein YdbT with pleckstrin-like domain